MFFSRAESYDDDNQKLIDLGIPWLESLRDTIIAISKREPDKINAKNIAAVNQATEVIYNGVKLLLQQYLLNRNRAHPTLIRDLLDKINEGVNIALTEGAKKLPIDCRAKLIKISNVLSATVDNIKYIDPFAGFEWSRSDEPRVKQKLA